MYQKFYCSPSEIVSENRQSLVPIIDSEYNKDHKGLVSNSVCPGANLRLLFPQREPGRPEVLAQRKYHTWPGKALHLHGPETMAPLRDSVQ